MILSLQDQNMTAAAQQRFGLACLVSRTGESFPATTSLVSFDSLDSAARLSHREWRRNAYAAAPANTRSISILGGRQGEKPVGTRMLAKSLNLVLPGLDPSANQEGGP